MELPDFCREIENYLCRKNDGHLIRVVGPSFSLVSGWAQQGVPLKVAFAGIDRYFERYYRAGPRRRPVKIDFCEADILDVFDEWQRATGVIGSRQTHVGSPESVESRESSVASQSHESLAAHLRRVVTRFTTARASGTIGDAFDPLIDRASRALDVARSKSGGVRGEARRQLLDELARLDAAVIETARNQLDAASVRALDAEAASDLAAFRAAMATDAYDRARIAAADQLIRVRLNLPTIRYEQG